MPPARVVQAHARWRVRLLGAFELHDEAQRSTRLANRATTLLLARLALGAGRDHAREELIELLWPETALAVGRNRLRQTLSVLRSVLEPAGSSGAPVLLADRRSLRLVPGSLVCDAETFEAALRRGDHAAAAQCYGGELLPGFYDDWVIEERLRLAALADGLQAADAAQAKPVLAPVLAPVLPLVPPPVPAAAFDLLPALPALPAAAALPLASRMMGPAVPAQAFHAEQPIPAAQAANAAPLPHRGWPAPAMPAGSTARTAPHPSVHSSGSSGPSPVPSPVPAPGHHRLPLYLTRLLGFEAAGAALAAAVQQHRLVVLRGPGGAGKTRLAVEVARALTQPQAWRDAAGWPFDTVAFVPLAACEARAAFHDAVLLALQRDAVLADTASANTAGLAQAADRLDRALAGRRALLVLDNFEQLVDAARQDLTAWLARMPGLHLLVTSRRALGLDGEVEQALAALPLPARDAPLHTLALNPAVALFVDRARAVRADFHLGERNCALVAGIVCQLHGLPLALELAAARVRSLSLADMHAMLVSAAREAPGRGLALLARSGPRAADDARHASMLRVVQWSWQHLDAAGRRRLTLLAAFDGGATLQALQDMACNEVPQPSVTLMAGQGPDLACDKATGAGFGVANDSTSPQARSLPHDAAHAAAPRARPVASDPDPDPEFAVADASLVAAAVGLDDLVAASVAFVRAGAGGEGGAGGAGRYHAFEPVREYALSLLDDASRAALRRRHLHTLLRWARSLGPAPSLDEFRDELPNLLTALATAQACRLPALAVQLSLHCAAALADVALPPSGLDRLRDALVALTEPGAPSGGAGEVDGQSADAAERLGPGGSVACAASDTDAAANSCSDACIDARTETSADSGIAAGLVPRVDCCAVRWRAGANAELAADGHALMAHLSFDAGQRDAALAHADHALRLAPRGSAVDARAHYAAARVALRVRNDTGRAATLAQEALTLARRRGLQGVQAQVLVLQAVLAMRVEHDLTRDEALKRQALALWQALGRPARVAAAQVGLAISMGFARRFAEQLQLLDQASQAAAANGQRTLWAFAQSVQGYVLADLARWDASARSYLGCLRTAWDIGAWREWFYALWNLPRTLAHSRRPEAAARLMGFADAFYAQRFGTLGWEDARERRRTRRLVRVQLGAVREAALWHEGAGLTLAQAMALADGEAQRLAGP